MYSVAENSWALFLGNDWAYFKTIKQYICDTFKRFTSAVGTNRPECYRQGKQVRKYWTLLVFSWEVLTISKRITPALSDKSCCWWCLNACVTLHSCQYISKADAKRLIFDLPSRDQILTITLMSRKRRGEIWGFLHEMVAVSHAKKNLLTTLPRNNNVTLTKKKITVKCEPLWLQ